MEKKDVTFHFKEKVAVVTGANGQLGRKIVVAYRDAGARVFGFDVSIDTNREDGIEYLPVDIRVPSDVEHAFAAVSKTAGKIDILVNNAGVSTFESFEERSEEQFDWVTDVNLKGTFLCIQAYVKEYDKVQGTRGAIVNIASLYGMVSPDFRIYTDCVRKNSEVYGASKAGVIQMTKYFGVHLADRGIRVNAVSPGGVYNPVHPQGEDFIQQYSFRCPTKRMANDTEISPAVLFLSSDEASYVTGQNLAVDGGMSSW